MYKLKAADTRERQYWVSRLRREVERCNSKSSKEVGIVLGKRMLQVTFKRAHFELLNAYLLF